MLYSLLERIDAVSIPFFSIMEKELIYSSILFVIVLLLMRVFRKQSPYLQYGLLSMVFIRLLLPPGFNLEISGRALLDELNVLPSYSESIQALTNSTTTTSNSTYEKSINEKNPLSAAQISTLRTPSHQNHNFNYFRLIVFSIWVVGVLGFVIIFFRRFLYYNGIVRNAKLITESNYTGLVKIWSKRFNIKRHVRLVTSNKGLSPFTIGVFRPIIYIPETLLSNLTKETTESVIAHELAHVRNYDDLWIKFQNIVQIIYFFHPVAWFANSRINEVRERICDEMVLSHEKISPKAYGRSMLDVLKMNLAGPEGVEILPGFGDHKKKFSTRITKIANVSKIKKSNLLIVGFILLVFAILLLPMSGSKTSFANDEAFMVVELERRVNGDCNYYFSTKRAGSAFQTISEESRRNIFCSTKLPEHLCDLEFAALGVYDQDFRKVWLLKGVNDKDEYEFYLDTNGDQCFKDEKPIKIQKKNTKYNYEGSAEWVEAEYIKANTSVNYRPDTNGDIAKMAIHLFYTPKTNFIEFSNNEFWLGKTQFAGKNYKVALYGGLQASWFLRPTFDEVPMPMTQNEIRIDFNNNDVFEEMTVYDPQSNQVVQEKFNLNEPFEVNGKRYEVHSVKKDNEKLMLEIVPFNPHKNRVGIAS